MVHHALYQKQNYSYAGVIEALSGAAFDVRFLSFDDLKENPDALHGVDVLLNIGDGDTAHTGGTAWEDADVSAAIRRFVAEGGGLIGIGEPSGHQYQGHYLQLASVLGVEKETGFTLGYDKYNWDEHPNHFILADCAGEVNFGEGKKNIYALDGTEILVQREKRCRWPYTNTARGAQSTCPACRTALKTQDSCTAQFCGAAMPSRCCIRGSRKITVSRCTPTRRTENTAW